MRNLIIILFLLATLHTVGQIKERPDIFVDCSGTRCDMDYFRTEIDIVNFVLNQVSADIHILITTQRTGGGGVNYDMIFYGQNEFEGIDQEIDFNTGPNFTDFERREELLRHIKIGLMPYLIEMNAFSDVDIEMKSGNPLSTKELIGEDPWKYWVFRTSLEGGISADRNYQNFEINSSVSANRTTDKMKFIMDFDYGKESRRISVEEDGVEREILVENRRYDVTNLLALTFSDHWSYGYIARISSNTFTNNQFRIFFQPSIEYSFFPYNEVNNRYWTIRYGIDYRHNRYYETTVLNKDQESLWGHAIEVNIQYNQKWGSIRGGIDARTFFHDWELYNLGIFYDIEVRISGGLSVFTNLYGGLINDQFYLPGGEATEEEILTQQRQLETSFDIWANFGFSFRFGSEQNNFVNPRFR